MNERQTGAAGDRERLVPRYASADETGAVPLVMDPQASAALPHVVKAAVPAPMQDAGPPTPTCIRTATGRYFDLARPTPDQVFLRDIAEQQAKINRFTGATVGGTLSVAQHSVYVSYVVEDLGHDEAAPYALLHDSEEAYTNDWSTPLKRTFSLRGIGAITDLIAHDIRRAIFQRFGLLWPVPAAIWKAVKEADAIAFVTERRDMMPGGDHTAPWRAGEPAPRKHPIVSWPWPKAADEFLHRAQQLGLTEI